MQKGNIRVQTENIFPIIKKFLYSDHEIFIRELVSNAVDATQKLKTLSSIGEAKGEIGDINITILIDKEKKTLTISDRGVGMTEELEDPERICCPPVIFIAVEDDGGLVADTVAGHEVGETLAIQVIAAEFVVQVADPIDLDRAGNVALIVEENVFVGFDDAD